jgi:hypothetical protein
MFWIRIGSGSHGLVDPDPGKSKKFQKEKKIKKFQVSVGLKASPESWSLQVPRRGFSGMYDGFWSKYFFFIKTLVRIRIGIQIGSGFINILDLYLRIQ